MCVSLCVAVDMEGRCCDVGVVKLNKGSVIDEMNDWRPIKLSGERVEKRVESLISLGLYRTRLEA